MKINEEIILDILEDAVNFFKNSDKDEHETSQKYAGIKELFHRHGDED